MMFDPTDQRASYAAHSSMLTATLSLCCPPNPYLLLLFQIIYCDDVMLVSREASEDIGVSDLYSLWKKVLPSIWIKY